MSEPKKKILIIEDERELLLEIGTMLGYENFEVIPSTNGNDGIRLANEYKPDLILCDIIMAGTDGFDVLRHIRKNSCTQTIPFIFITAFAEWKAMRKGMELGADDYLVKPFSRIDLLKAVKVRLERATEMQKQIKELKCNILYCVPHELQTPLNVIVGFSKSMNEDFGSLSIEDITEMSRAIYDSGIRLSSTVKKFLMLINVELNKPEKTFTRVLFTNSDICAMTQNIAQKYSRTDDLVIKCPDIELTVIKDWFLFVLSELIDNAFKFSCHGGKVIIAAEKVKNKIRIAISDNGIGFPPGVTEKIYAFTQFDRKIYEQQGAGLGLFLAKKIISLHGGEILIESKQKIGSNIIIDLPQ